jgi:hypothetical protein
LNALTKGVPLRPEFFREDFIDDRDHGAAGLGRFSLSENSAAEQGQTDGCKLIGPHAIPGGAKG